MITTIEIEDVTFIVDYDYQPKEEPTLTYPGCDEEATLNAVFVGDVDVFKNLPERLKDKITDVIWGVIYA